MQQLSPGAIGMLVGQWLAGTAGVHEMCRSNNKIHQKSLPNHQACHSQQ